MHFSVDGTESTLWHVDVTTAPGVAPVGTWQPLVSMVAPGDVTLKQQLDLVNGWSDLRADRAREIAAQMAPQYAFWGSVVPLHRARHPRTLELVHLVLRVAKFAEMNFKHALCVRRPHEYSAQVQPIIQTPAHGSLPSGHATEAFAVGMVLYELMSTSTGGAANVQLRDLLRRQAARIAINRTVAGVHFPVDSMAGQMLGMSIAEYFIARTKPATIAGGGAAAPTRIGTWKFDGAKFPGGTDFTGDEQVIAATGARNPTVYALLTATAAAGPSVKGSNTLNWLWQAAVSEWT